jgi:hypothetical protein
MKKYYWLLILHLSWALAACEKDDDGANPNLLPDTVSPVIEITSPAPNDSILVIEGINLVAEISDDKRLDNVRTVLMDGSGGSRLIADQTITVYTDYRTFILSTFHPIPKHSAAGEYIISIEAKDKGQNVTQNAVTFTVYASDIHSETFVKAFGNVLISEFNDILDKSGYNFWDQGYSFDKAWFSTILKLMISTDNKDTVSEAEWGKFIADFSLEGQTWLVWDQNSDGKLDDKEFYDGITSLNLFDNWDKNQDSLLYLDELADGIFTYWDLNQDNLLSREEYLEKFYTYVYR